MPVSCSSAQASVSEWKYARVIACVLSQSTNIGPPQPPRVLLAEDDLELLELLTTRLTEHGYEILPCRTGLALVAELERAVRRRGHSRVDLIVTDIWLPGVTGLSVMKGLDALGRPCPAIVMSAFLDEETRCAARTLHPSALVEKPFDVQVLDSLIDGVIERQRAWDRAWRESGYDELRR